MTEFRHEITVALAPMARRLDGIERRQIQQGELIARLDGRLDERLLLTRLGERTPAAAHPAPGPDYAPTKVLGSSGRLNGHAKTMGGAGMMAVVWALVEVIQTLIAAP